MSTITVEDFVAAPMKAVMQSTTDVVSICSIEGKASAILISPDLYELLYLYKVEYERIRRHSPIPNALNALPPDFF